MCIKYGSSLGIYTPEEATLITIAISDNIEVMRTVQEFKRVLERGREIYMLNRCPYEYMLTLPPEYRTPTVTTYAKWKFS